MPSSLPILVTGAAGFIGARFVASLNEQGVPVLSVDARSHFEDRPEHRSVDFGKIIEREDLIGWLGETKPKLAAVVHLGACTDTTELDVALLNRLNLEYSQALWGYCSVQRVPLVYASSAATYGDGSQGYDDDERKLAVLKPLNPYGESKHRFDLWALEREREGVAPPTWAGFKFFNVYGFGERHKGKMASVVLHAFDQIAVNGRLKLFRSEREDIAHGHQARDFISAEDVLRILTFALEKPIRRGIFNLGTGRARTYLDLGHAVFAALNVSPAIDFIPMPENLSARYQYFTEARMTRLRDEGYRAPCLSLEEGIARYISRLQKFY